MLPAAHILLLVPCIYRQALEHVAAVLCPIPVLGPSPVPALALNMVPAHTIPALGPAHSTPGADPVWGSASVSDPVQAQELTFLVLRQGALEAL